MDDKKEDAEGVLKLSSLTEKSRIHIQTPIG